MNLNLDTRETKLTEAEFNALARNTDGDVINLSGLSFHHRYATRVPDR